MLLALGLPGVTALGRLSAQLDAVECWVYGLPLGIVAGSLVMLGSALVTGELSVAIIATVSVASLAGAVAFRPGRRGPLDWGSPRGRFGEAARAAMRYAGPFSLALLAMFVLTWGALFARVLVTDAQGLWAGQVNVWGDWALHLGDVTSFAYGDNFPAENPRFAGEPLPYHYLSSLTCAAAVKLGMTPAGSLALHSFLLALACLLGLFAFARRLTADRAAAGAATGLFLLGGGLGWVVTAVDVNETKDLGSLVRAPWHPESQREYGFAWMNQFAAMIEPQRGYLYGLPLTLLILTLLLIGVRDWRPWTFAAAGAVAGTLPIAHSSSLVALAMITPFLALLFRTDPLTWLRSWALFFGVWVAAAVPQMLVQNGGGAGPASSIRWQVGWLADSGSEPWLWFWAKNLGWFLPLLAVALFDRRLLPTESWRVVWACMPIFVVCNLIAFLPWDWDNTKFLFYWFLAVCIAVGALLAKLWRESPAPAVRLLVAGAVTTMVASGVLVNAAQLTGKDRHLMLTAEELRIAQLVRERTPAQSVFVTDFRHDNPISVVAGRRVVTGYSGWLFSEGVDFAERERDVRALYKLGPDFDSLVARYGIDYVVVGPGERETFSADAAAFRARFPLTVSTASYEVFRVG